MKRYKILTVIFNIVAICLFITAIIAVSSGKSEPSTGLILSCSGFLFLAAARLFSRKQSESEKAESFASTEQPIPEEGEEYLPVTSSVYAEVVDMVCGTDMVPEQGYRLQKSVNFFFIKFKTEDEKILEFSVEDEIYQSFDVGMKGTLTYVDDQLFGFEPEN